MLKQHIVTGGSYARADHRVTYREVESLCSPSETNVTLGVNYTQVKKLKNKNK